MTQVNLSKLVTYAVNQEGEKVSISKHNAYAVQQGTYGTLFQDVNPDRPLYRDAPSGGVPYADMSATGAYFKINVPLAGTYTFVVYKSDQTFDVFEADLVSGPQTFPVTEDFNQVVGLYGKNLHRFTIDSIKEGIKARI